MDGLQKVRKFFEVVVEKAARIVLHLSSMLNSDRRTRPIYNVTKTTNSTYALTGDREEESYNHRRQQYSNRMLPWGTPGTVTRPKYAALLLRSYNDYTLKAE